MADRVQVAGISKIIRQQAMVKEVSVRWKLCGLGVQGDMLSLPPGGPAFQGGPGRLFSGTLISVSYKGIITPASRCKSSCLVAQMVKNPPAMQDTKF